VQSLITTRKWNYNDSLSNPQHFCFVINNIVCIHNNLAKSTQSYIHLRTLFSFGERIHDRLDHNLCYQSVLGKSDFILIHSFSRATSSFFANQKNIPLKHKIVQFDHTTTSRNTLAPYKNQNYTMQNPVTQLQLETLSNYSIRA